MRHSTNANSFGKRERSTATETRWLPALVMRGIIARDAVWSRDTSAEIAGETCVHRRSSANKATAWLRPPKRGSADQR